MQQLLGDHLPTPDNAFLKELFLQRLPANVRMVLASADPSNELPKLAEMADKIIEVATPPTVAATSTPVSEVQQLREEVSRLAELVAAITAGHRRQRARSRSTGRRPQSPACLDHQTPQTSQPPTPSAGTTKNSATQPRSASNPATGETSEPDTCGD